MTVLAVLWGWGVGLSVAISLLRRRCLKHVSTVYPLSRLCKLPAGSPHTGPVVVFRNRREAVGNAREEGNRIVLEAC